MRTHVVEPIEDKDEKTEITITVKEKKPVEKEVMQNMPSLKEVPIEKKIPAKEKTISFRVLEEDKKLLDLFSSKVNGTSSGAFCKKLLFDTYNSKGSNATKILELLEDFDSLSKAEVIELVKEKEKEILATERTKKDKELKRVHRKLNTEKE